MAEQACLRTECGGTANASGLCVKHVRAVPIADRFWLYVDKSDTCWRWRGTPDNDGYGRYAKKLAHRFAYELAIGPIPAGMEIDHLCRVPACVRPDHLRVVTRKQNAEHMSGPQANNTSGVRGVSWSKKSQKWKVSVKHFGKQHHGGFFPDLASAECAAIELRNRLHTHNDEDRLAG